MSVNGTPGLEMASLRPQVPQSIQGLPHRPVCHIRDAKLIPNCYCTRHPTWNSWNAPYSNEKEGTNTDLKSSTTNSRVQVYQLW